MRRVGLSNGWEELALKKPPPLVPRSLIASWLATGPPGICCWVTGVVTVAPLSSVVSTCTVLSTVVAVVVWVKFWIAPWLTKTMAITNEMGSRMRVVVRVRSTQKLPRVRPRRRASPRMRPTTMTMPTAADTKFCTARPAICTRWPMVDSPE